MKTQIGNLLVALAFFSCIYHAAAQNNFTVLHNFNATTDGAYPVDRLVLSSNRLYGTCLSGGSGYQGYSGTGGTVFGVNTDGTGFTNLHNFSAINLTYNTNNDGAAPVAGLVVSSNILYGVAPWGGAHGVGTIFKIKTDSTGFTTLYNFTGIGSDGGEPGGDLILTHNQVPTNDVLYGTTSYGGTNGQGTVFGFDSGGAGFAPLFDFFPNQGSLIGSHAGVVLVGTALFGTLPNGSTGYGCVYQVNQVNNTPNSFGDLHDFIGTDGGVPQASLIASGNTFYGTTGGGFSVLVGNNYVFQYGSIFRVDIGGINFTNIHSFTNGESAVGALVLSGNTLYGTTQDGGNSGAGSIYKINTDGTGYATLFSFTNTSTGYPNGSNPAAGLILSGNTLYGTTEYGGTNNSGVVFAFSLASSSPALSIGMSGTGVTISWASSASGFVLQQNSNLATTNWITSGYAISTNGAVESITIMPPPENLFFRLAHP